MCIIVNHIHKNVQRFYCKVTSVLFDLKYIPSDVKSKLIDSYCLDLYGSQLWKNSKNDINASYFYCLAESSSTNLENSEY